MSAAVAVTPQMCRAVLTIANDALAEQGAYQHPVTASPDAEHLLVADADDRLILWVAASGPTGWGVTWGGWVTADGRTADTLSDVEEAMSR